MEYNIEKALKQISYVRLNKHKYFFNIFEFFNLIPLGPFQNDYTIKKNCDRICLFKDYDLITPVNVLKCLLLKQVSKFPHVCQTYV